MKIPTVTGNLLDHLRDEILTGRLVSGEKINEIKLANELEISRSPIREVLRILENERLVENIPRKGTFVSKISFRDFYETYLISEMVEIKAIDILKENSIRELSAVERAIESEKSEVMPPVDSSATVILEHLKKMFEFHLSMVKSTGNLRLYAFFKDIHFTILRYHFYYGLAKVTKNRASDHIEILAAIKSRNYKKAKIIIKTHIQDHVNKISVALKEN